MLEAPQSVVAIVAQEAPDFSGLVAMIDGEASEVLGVVDAADCTALALTGEHGVIFGDRDAIGLSEIVSSLDRWTARCMVSPVVSLPSPLRVGNAGLLPVQRLAGTAMTPMLPSTVSIPPAELVNSLGFPALRTAFHDTLGTVATVL